MRISVILYKMTIIKMNAYERWTDMHTLIHALEHSFLDSIKLMPFIFLIYFIIEYFEHKNNTELSHVLQKSKKLGVVCGALLGSVPQCGFSVIAADMYSKKSITLGTLIAIFIATSDEAVPIILSHPEKAYFVIAVIIVAVVVLIIYLKKRSKKKEEDLLNEGKISIENPTDSDLQ